MPVKKKDSLLIVFIVAGFLLTLYFGANITVYSKLNPKGDTFGIINEALDATFMFKTSLSEILKVEPSKLWQAIGICTMLYALAAMWIVVEIQRKQHFKKGIECGSSKWQDDLDSYNKKYTDPAGSKDSNGPYNMILTNDVKLNMNTFVTRLNNNVTVVGGSGSGKSRFFVKPNILQANTNYVITDPSGELLESTGKFLEDQGYTIKVFNLVEMAKSNCYNPFDYIRDDLGVVMMIKCLIKNTTPPGQKSGDPFWEKSEEALLQAISFYLIEARPKKDRNFTTVMKLLRCAEVNENDPSAESTLDKLFKAHEKENPNSLAVKQYKIFKMGAGKTLKSILISCSVRLTVFNLEQIASLTRSDDENGVELEKMGEGKKALFVIIPSADSTYNFLVSMMYSQLFETLYFVAETKRANKKLESPIRFLLDEFANIGEIPEFTKKLATMRKYEISCSIILQNIAQIKTMYKDDWQTILGNCDSFLFLGGQEYETVEYISKELGNATITVRDNSQSLGKNKNMNQSYKQTKRELMTPNELMTMSGDECILLIRGLNPFRSTKFQYQKHKNYKYTGDADKSRKYKLKVLNQVSMTKDEVDALREKFYAKASSAKGKKNSLIGDAKPLAEALSDVKDPANVTVLDPTPINEANRRKTPSSSPSPFSPIKEEKEEKKAENAPHSLSSAPSPLKEEKAEISFTSLKEEKVSEKEKKKEIEKESNEVKNGYTSSAETKRESKEDVFPPENISSESEEEKKKKKNEEDANAGISKEEEGNFIAIEKEEDMDEWEV